MGGAAGDRGNQEPLRWRRLIDLVINRARSFIYSTAPPLANAAAAIAAVDSLTSPQGERRRQQLRSDLGQFAIVSENVQSLHIGGSVSSASALLSSGAVAITGNAGTLTIGHDIETGSVTGGGSVKYDGAVEVNANLGNLVVDGSILGSNSQRAYILAQGTPPAGGGNFNAIGKIMVKGSVSFAVIESGQAPKTTIGNAEQPDAGIGSVSIGGNFYHSSIMAGINDMPSNGGFPDGVDGNDTISGTAALGPITIGGAILDDESSGGDSGFEAHTIAKIVVAGRTRFVTGQAAPFLDPGGFVLAREL